MNKDVEINDLLNQYKEFKKDKDLYPRIKNEYPHHLEAMNIINQLANFTPDFVHEGESVHFTMGAMPLILKYDKTRIGSGVIINTDYMEKASLENFSFNYTHEIGHLVNSDPTNLHKKTIIRAISSKAAIYGPVFSVWNNMLPKTANLILASTTILTYFGINYFDKALKKDEHQQDLFSYNITGVMPSQALKEAILIDSGSYFIHNSIIGRVISPHPTPRQRDKYVLKNGDPKPDTRLLELFKIDKANRQEKGLF